MAESAVDEFGPATGRWLIGTLAGWATLLLCFVGVGLLILLVVWFRNRFTRYSITNERLLIHRGVIFRGIDEIELYRVKDIQLEYSLLNEMAGIGTIVLKTSDVSTQDRPLRLAHIPNAKARRETLRNIVEALRRKLGVRELDTGAARLD